MQSSILSKKFLWRAFIGIIIVVTIIVPILYHIQSSLEGKPTKYDSWVMGFLFTFVVTALISLVNLSVFSFFNNKYKNHNKYLRLFILELVISSVLAAIIMIAVVMAFFFFIGELPEDNITLESTLYNNAIIAVVINAIICTLTEAYILFQHWKKTTIESERLRRETAESKYAALKNQVNPHFLFNSLNTLSSLIRVSPEKAIEFVDKFSKIYRYVLDSTDKVLVELREELNFLQSFIYLQKIRFGDNLQVDINIDAKYLNDFIPPLAMQLLVENALKHNEVSTEFPLKITIEIVDNYLVISNNLQLKKGLEGSTGIGLKNLEARYNQFSELKPFFMATSDTYIAKIPLIKEAE